MHNRKSMELDKNFTNADGWESYRGQHEEKSIIQKEQKR